MKTITTVITRAVDLDAGICHPHKLHKKLIRGNAFAHAFKVACYRDGEPVDISNATCWGYVRRADGETIELEGTVKGNTAQIILSAACYLILGWATISLELELDGVSATHGIWLAEVRSSRSDHVTDGEPVIPETLPNPFPLIFTGAVNAVYDGSELVYVHIPTGGSMPDEPAVPDEPVILPTYWQSHVDTRVADVNSAYEQAGSDKSTFLFYSDAHWTYNYQQSPNLLAYLTRNTPIDKVIFGGDIMDAEDDTSYIAEWRAQIADLPSHHSVVGNHDDGNTPDGRWTAEEVYEFLLAPEVTPDVVRGGTLYYHIDVAAEKTRYLYIDSASRTGAIAWDEDQKAWLEQTLLSTPAGWHIIPVAHIWAVPDYTTTPPTAGTLGDCANFMLELFDQYNARLGDFASCDARVEFCIGGHTHRDSEFYSPDGIPVILVECDSRHVRSGLSCSEGAITENSVSAIVADYTAGVVKVIRIGRGSSRNVGLNSSTDWMYTSITRVLQTSDDTVAIEWSNKFDGVTYVVFDGETEVARVNNNTQTVLFNVAPGAHSYTVCPQKSDSDVGKRSAVVSLTTVADVGFTNMLRVATDTDGTLYNGGFGYRENTRYSSSSGSEVYVDGWDITGYMPAVSGDVIRFYNMDFDDVENTGGEYKRNQVSGYNADYSFITNVNGVDVNDTRWQVMRDAAGDLIQFTFDGSWNSLADNARLALFSVQAKNVDAFSIITVNEEINI